MNLGCVSRFRNREVVGLLRDLEYHTKIARAPLNCGAVQVSRRVDHQTRVGISSVSPAGEIVEHGFLPESVRQRKLINRAVFVGSAKRRRAVEVTGLVDDQLALGKTPITSASEVMHCREVPITPGRREFEYVPHRIESPEGRSAVNVAGGIEHDCGRLIPVLTAGESIKRGFRPSPAGGHKFENGSQAIHAAAIGRAVKIAAWVEGQSRGIE